MKLPPRWILLHAKRGKATKTYGEGKKDHNKPKLVEVLPKTVNFIGSCVPQSSALERAIETFPLALQGKHLLVILKNYSWEGKVGANENIRVSRLCSHMCLLSGSSWSLIQ